MTEIEAPGWDAIDARHVGYHPPKGFVGGALQGCSAYPAEGHWHYITYGLSEKAEMLATSTADVLARLADENPLLITDPGRSSGGGEVWRA
ncbi:hypothetical protein [Kutzneria chonburiensis]|uniref:Uncharacterized protein n=1 Tax=Kutzneria chonburiensis TaxID=1483604 RepID=A0ABV6MPY5_9PSEU|nr:hypothetical protein [Kutzneria chonburiensis]